MSKLWQNLQKQKEFKRTSSSLPGAQTGWLANLPETGFIKTTRVRKLLNCLNDEELVDLVLPRIAKIVSPVDFLLHGTDGTRDFHSKLCKFRNELFLRFPELQALFCPEPSPSTGFYNQRQVFTEIVQKNKPYSCDWLLEIDNGSFFKDVVMPCVFRKQHSAFMEFSCGIVGSLAIGQKETHDVLRNKGGEKIGRGHWHQSNFK